MLKSSAGMSDTPTRPILYWDRDCGFCRGWVERWRESTGGTVVYQTVQDAPPEVREAAGGLPPRRMVLARADGILVTGAAAALSLLAPHSLRARGLLAAYHAVPPFAAASEAAYRAVATHRGFFGFLTRLLWGASPSLPRYQISGWLFPRAMGLIFLAAFLSLWVQIDGLSGSQGILPVGEHLAAVENYFHQAGNPYEAFWQFPTLLWLGSSDAALHTILLAGLTASLLLVLGLIPAPAALAAWACYLSFATATPLWLDFQWDALLLEAGLLTALFVPWRRHIARGASEPPRWGRLLIWWLLFRLMLESGMAKLHGYDTHGINAWLNGTAMGFHYFTQPIPAWTSWWAAQWPAWFQRLSIYAVFVIELILPFAIFGPRRLRMVVFWGFTLLMALIMATGNFGFFNLLALTLCLTLVDDAVWPRAVRKLLVSPVPRPLPHLQSRLIPWAAAALLVPSACTLLLVLRLNPAGLAAAVVRPLAPLRSVNTYGLFSVMTTERPEITLEASEDGVIWMPYRFRYKMDTNKTRMPFFIPHMPRLDWMMWFAALEYRASGHPPGWIAPLLERLRDGSPAVKGLLLPGGAAEITPSEFRLRLDLLRFTTPEERRTTGRVWKAEPLPAYTLEGRLN